MMMMMIVLAFLVLTLTWVLNKYAPIILNCHYLRDHFGLVLPMSGKWKKVSYTEACRVLLCNDLGKVSRTIVPQSLNSIIWY